MKPRLQGVWVRLNDVCETAEAVPFEFEMWSEKTAGKRKRRSKGVKNKTM